MSKLKFATVMVLLSLFFLLAILSSAARIVIEASRLRIRGNR